MFSFLLILFLAAGTASASGLETGAVVRSDDGAFFRNAIPQIARMADGRLLAVWGAVGKSDGNGRVCGAFSADGAKTWSQPRLLIDDPAMDDGDPQHPGGRQYGLGLRHARPHSQRHPQSLDQHDQERRRRQYVVQA